MRRLGVAAAIVADRLVEGDVGVDGGVIAAVGLPGGRAGLAVPGFVDLQVNGYAGVDFLTSPAPDWVIAASALARAGVTSYVANFITAPDAMLLAALRTARAVQAAPAAGGARFIGAHLEGPFLSPQRAGTHPPALLSAPSVSLTDSWLGRGPVVGMTLAPELPGALRVIAFLRSRRVLVALGHSEATGAQAHAGFDAGASTVTHVFNGMSTPTAREPGLAGVALARPDVAVQLICDGVHLAPETAALVVAAARSRFVLVTDALSSAGAPGGRHRLGSLAITVTTGRRATTTAGWQAAS